MAIIGRKEEIRELERCEKSNKSELICIYGRRRVGKTYLVEQTYADYFDFVQPEWKVAIHAHS